MLNAILVLSDSDWDEGIAPAADSSSCSSRYGSSKASPYKPLFILIRFIPFPIMQSTETSCRMHLVAIFY